MWGWLLLHYEGKEDYIRTLKGVLSVCAVLLEHYKLLFLRVPLDVSPSVLFSEGKMKADSTHSSHSTSNKEHTNPDLPRI